MEIIVLLIGISVAIAGSFLLLFCWNFKSGQYDDIYTPSVRMLFDDKQPKLDTKARGSTNVVSNHLKTIAIKPKARNKKKP
jgi:cbb3-type cytochrome oxidase maturation protein